MLEESRVGTLISMGDIYSNAHTIKRLGEHGHKLAGEAEKLGMEERVRRDIAYVARILSVYSDVLLSLAERLSMPIRTFPLYTTELELLVPKEEVYDPLDDILEGA